MLPAAAREALLARLAARRKVADARQGRALPLVSCASLRNAMPLEETMWLDRRAGNGARSTGPRSTGAD